MSKVQSFYIPPKASFPFFCRNTFDKCHRSSAAGLKWKSLDADSVISHSDNSVTMRYDLHIGIARGSKVTPWVSNCEQIWLVLGGTNEIGEGLGSKKKKYFISGFYK